VHSKLIETNSLYRSLNIYTINVLSAVTLGGAYERRQRFQ